jgi:hypothetical protein
MSKPEINEGATDHHYDIIARAISEYCYNCDDDGGGCADCTLYDFGVMNYVYEPLDRDEEAAR